MHELITRTITGALFGTLLGATFFLFPPICFSFLMVLIALYIIIVEWARLFNWRQCAFWLIMPFYPLASFALFIMLNEQPEYRMLLSIMIFIVVAHDSGAYLVGKAWGRHKLCPVISPKKSWEGFVGGFLATCAALMLVMPGVRTAWACGLIIALSITVLATVGDLFESALKRRAGLKDTGALLPGHGGLLDRFDSWLFVIVFFYLFKEQLFLLL